MGSGIVKEEMKRKGEDRISRKELVFVIIDGIGSMISFALIRYRLYQ